MDLWICSQELWPLDHRRSLSHSKKKECWGACFDLGKGPRNRRKNIWVLCNRAWMSGLLNTEQCHALRRLNCDKVIVLWELRAWPKLDSATPGNFFQRYYGSQDKRRCGDWRLCQVLFPRRRLMRNSDVWLCYALTACITMYTDMSERRICKRSSRRGSRVPHRKFGIPSHVLCS
jgi:hypothetical protein